MIESHAAVEFIRDALTRREKANYEVSRAVEKQYAIPRSDRNVITPGSKQKLIFEPRKLEQIADRISADISDDWLADRSPSSLANITPSDFLSCLYVPGETVAIVTGDAGGSPSVLNWLWRHDENLSSLATGQQSGVWFQANPVSGDPVECEDRTSYRCEACVTAWRYGVLESDFSKYDHLWRKVLVQLPLAMVAIYTSGGRSTHCLYRLDGIDSKPAFDTIVRSGRMSLMAQLVPVGADPAVFRGVQLSRLPGCRREEKGNMQKLLYLNPAAKDQPIL
jgi:hypothetical protein